MTSVVWRFRYYIYFKQQKVLIEKRAWETYVMFLPCDLHVTHIARYTELAQSC
jgi:hypothetical protein